MIDRPTVSIESDLIFNFLLGFWPTHMENRFQWHLWLFKINRYCTHSTDICLYNMSSFRTCVGWKGQDCIENTNLIYHPMLLLRKHFTVLYASTIYMCVCVCVCRYMSLYACALLYVNVVLKTNLKMERGPSSIL